MFPWPICWILAFLYLPKLLSISKEINFCLGRRCKLELVTGCCGKLPRPMACWWLERLRPVAMSALRQKLGSSADREEEMAFVEGNKSVFQADKLWPWSFCHLHVFQQEREKQPACLSDTPCPGKKDGHTRARTPTPFSYPLALWLRVPPCPRNITGCWW